MERGKLPVKRGPKIKTLPLPGDFIALGSKSARTPSTPESVPEPKLSSSQLKGNHSLQLPSSSGERKREASGISINPTLSKKSKVSSSQSVSVISRPPGIKKEKDLKKGEHWDSIAIDIDPEEFMSQIQDAEESGDSEQIERLLCGAVKYLRVNRAKPEPVLYLSLMYLVKTNPLFFRSETVLEAFSILLKRDVSLNFKSKGNSLVAVLAANVLMFAFQEEKDWPDIMLMVYLDDALGERVWVDHDDCKGFVDNIQTAFNTKIPSKSMMQPEFGFKPDVCPSPPPLLPDDEDTGESATSGDAKDTQDVAVVPRFSHVQEHVEQYVLEIIREQVARRQPMDNISRNVLRLLTCTCGLSEVRLLAAQRLEIWLQNPKLMRPAQELLLSVCINCNQRSQQDVEVISHLTKIRLKTKPLINHYLVCIRELLNQSEENLGILLKHTIYNELSNSRNPNNMSLLGVMFQFSADQTAKTLAEVFQDLLMNREDYLRALRALFREIVRSLRFDINFSAFCLGLIQERKDAMFRELDSQLKERMFLSIADLITLSIFMGITPAVREAASAYARGDKKDMSVLRNYQQLVASIQRDAVWWLQTIAPRMYKPQRLDFIHCIHKILFMEQAEHYHNKDNWPPENDRPMMLRLASEIPVLENTLLRVLIIGLSKEHPLSAPDAHELSEQLVKRAAAIYTEDFQVIQVDSIDLIDVLFNICAYHHPENISLPAGYNPPNLAISNLYWKAWIMLLVITAHNPSTFGFAAWENFPTLSSFIEMSITNHFIFPPPTMAVGEKADEIKNRELQIAHLEKQEILEFENHLASASTKVTITESNSLLLPQLTTMDPGGIARKPPANVLEQLKTLNQNLKLGHLLCRSRNPDFLLDIIQRQGTSQSMPWLADLVESSEGSFSALPVQCLCEFLLNESPESLKVNSESDKEEKEESKSEKVERAKKKEKMRKQQQLLQHLHGLLYENSEESRSTSDVLDYFLRRLSSQQSGARNQAIKGLRMIISPPLKPEEEEDEEMSADKEENLGFNWLLKYLPNLAHFEAIRADTSVSLRQACLVETNPWAVSAYIQFLATFAPDEQLQELADLGLNMAQLIVERTTIVNYILPCEGSPVSEQKMLTLQALMIIFLKYLRKAREPCKEAYSWSESQDQIIVQWPSGEVATMHVLVVHAMVILLTYGPPENSSLFSELLDIWFPKNSELPQAFLVDTSEEALLLPDWLKLRMIRSSVDALVDAALRDLDPSQLILFIQSFGIPITSVSKLLHALDIAVEYDSYSVDNAVIDKSYMSQLVEVQQRRGAIGGEKFAELLDEGMQTETEYISAEPIQPLKQNDSLMLQSPKAVIQPDSVKRKLISLFCLESNLPQNKEQQEIFRSLQKVLAQEIHSEAKPVTVKVITCLSQLISSHDGTKVVKALHQFPFFSCPLFRMLQMLRIKNKMYANEAKILITMQGKILEMSQGMRSPLVNIVKQAVKENGSKSKIEGGNLLRTIKIPQELTEDSIIKTIEKAVSTSRVHLEQIVDRLALQSLQANNSLPLVKALVRLLLKESHDPGHSSSFFVDWLELLEPEIVSSVPELEQQLLFSRPQRGTIPNDKDKTIDSLRPYLLTTLIHQASWPIIHQCLAEILQPIHLKNFDSSTVLDFIYACVYIPKIWQGRDKHIPKHYREENLLGFSIPQVLCIIDYALDEVSSLSKSNATLPKEELNNNGTHDESKTEIQFSGQEVLKTLEKRLPLILHCCSNREEIMPAVVNHLLEIIEQNCSQSLTARYLLQQLYLKVPQLISWFEKTRIYIQDCGKLINSSSKLDAISQMLLTALASTDSGKQWKDKIQDIDLACRKMAACHPNLMLRQLSMLAALLRGRNQLEFTVFKARNYLNFFNCVMGLLELLQPHLFRADYSSALEDTFNSYFDLIKNYGLQNKELGGIINRFLMLLHNFITEDSHHAVKYIQKHSGILHDLSSIHPDMQSLRSLLAGISLPCQADDGLQDELVPTLLSFTPSQTTPTRIQGQMMPLLNRLSNENNVEEVLSALQELDNISNRKPDYLDYFVDELKKLISYESESCRNIAHKLIIRQIKQKPRTCKEFLNSILCCLDSEHQEVVISALERLAEFVLLSQENASLLLQKAFSVGISTSINTLPYIAETMMLLNMQSGS